MKIAVIGSGYVGLVSAACFAELGHEVVAVDNDANKIELLKAGHIPIHEEYLPELIARHRNQRLNFSSDLRAACRNADVIFICVGTPPSATGEADLSYVEGVAKELAGALDSPKVIVEKSTVPVGTCEAIYRTLVLYGASPSDFSIASNPEFLREGTAVMDFLCPDRILLGVPDERSRQAITAIYRPLVEATYWSGPTAIRFPNVPSKPLQIITSVKSAEMIKHASNAFLALKISYVNSVANVCERVGADVREVVHGMGSDSRIGPRFLNPGIGYGGSCFPKDVLAFRSVAASVGYDFSILTEVMEVNEDQKRRFVSKVRDAMWTLRNKKLAVLGLAFKGGTDDCRDSPAIDLIKMLYAEGARQERDSRRHGGVRAGRVCMLHRRGRPAGADGVARICRSGLADGLPVAEPAYCAGRQEPAGPGARSGCGHAVLRSRRQRGTGGGGAEIFHRASGTSARTKGRCSGAGELNSFSHSRLRWLRRPPRPFGTSLHGTADSPISDLRATCSHR